MRLRAKSLLPITYRAAQREHGWREGESLAKCRPAAAGPRQHWSRSLVKKTIVFALWAAIEWTICYGSSSRGSTRLRTRLALDKEGKYCMLANWPRLDEIPERNSAWYEERKRRETDDCDRPFIMPFLLRRWQPSAAGSSANLRCSVLRFGKKGCTSKRWAKE